MAEVFVADKIRCGYNHRRDTYTGKLAYVIYYDAKGKIRKEQSWNSWRDHSIEPHEFDNTPQVGFVINKGISRSTGGWHNDTVTKVRIWDPRGFEFEISLSNLICILQHSDVSKRDIVVPCVYAWEGTELILLPTNSDEYAAAQEHTSKQHNVFKSKDLVVGRTYESKRDKTNLIYLGYLPYYVNTVIKPDLVRTKYEAHRHPHIHETKTKKHVFVDMLRKQCVFTSPSSLISHVVDEEMSPRFAEANDIFYKTEHAQRYSHLTILEDIRGYGSWYDAGDGVFIKVESEVVGYTYKGKTIANQYIHDATSIDPDFDYKHVAPVVNVKVNYVATFDAETQAFDSTVRVSTRAYVYGRTHDVYEHSQWKLTDPRFTPHLENLKSLMTVQASILLQAEWERMIQRGANPKGWYLPRIFLYGSALSGTSDTIKIGNLAFVTEDGKHTIIHD